MEQAATSQADRQVLRTAMTLSLVTGIAMFFMKVTAYVLTGSAAILSDAAESVVHVAAVIFAAWSLRLSYKPADASHLYGHAKISFFSAGFEGAMIILAAGYIIYESIHKWLIGLHLEHLGLGTLITAAAAVINAGLGGYLVWIGKRKHSLILSANGKHVLTDCWTSAAVLVGLGLVLTTGWLAWDPLCGIAMAINILVSGGRLIQGASAGLMDKADPAVQRQLVGILEAQVQKHGISYHNLRHRNVGDAHWVELHLLFADDLPLGQAHRIATEVEDAIERALLPNAHVITHLESSTEHGELHPQEELARPKT